MVAIILIEQETDERTRRRQADNSAKLEHRRNDINFWKEELINESRNMENEICTIQVQTSYMNNIPVNVRYMYTYIYIYIYIYIYTYIYIYIIF